MWEFFLKVIDGKKGELLGKEWELFNDELFKIQFSVIGVSVLT